MAKSKLASRETAQGRIAAYLTPTSGSLIEVSDYHASLTPPQLNCETDFVARNEKFVALAQSLASEANALAKDAGFQQIATAVCVLHK